ncbi:replication protein [Planomonospora sphaerica]|uniref:Replication protein n=1 Tax=Planomonospora sphaerica TaxID=161355 RepID=A0A171DFC6_9ACTN|nr:poly-gamma-glutamate hydrolase family protein [Planomonospora sphaerica]GAT68224.1 replication protein [Planomonospora sphaerica]
MPGTGARIGAVLLVSSLAPALTAAPAHPHAAPAHPHAAPAHPHVTPAEPARTRPADKYTGYAQLAAHETEGRDYRREQRFPRGARVAHIAVHGGAIEPPTTQLANHSARAGRHAYYSFTAVKASGNRDLHITADRFDEPKARALVSRVDYTVAWHGAAGSRATTYIGGRDTALIRKIAAELRAAGFNVARSVPAGLRGRSPDNITNKNRRGRGVQLEISLGQRKRFFAGGRLDRAWIGDPANRTGAFRAYTAAVNRALPGS